MQWPWWSADTTATLFSSPAAGPGRVAAASAAADAPVPLTGLHPRRRGRRGYARRCLLGYRHGQAGVQRRRRVPLRPGRAGALDRLPPAALQALPGVVAPADAA